MHQILKKISLKWVKVLKVSKHSDFKHFPLYLGDLVTHTGDQEILSISRRVGIDVILCLTLVLEDLFFSSLHYFQ